MDITIYTVASLPSAALAPGSILLVTDATQNPANASGVVVTGGGTTRTRVLSDGTNWRVFGYSRKGGGFGGNLITQQDLTNAYWTLGGFTGAPPGTINETATSSPHTFGLTTGLPRPIGTGVYVFSVDLLKIGPDERWIAIGLFSIGLGSGSIAFFDVLTGVVNAQQAYGGFAVPVATMLAIPGGYRCTITTNCMGSAFSGITVLNQDTTPEGTFSYAGAIADGYTVSNLSLTQIG